MVIDFVPIVNISVDKNDFYVGEVATITTVAYVPPGFAGTYINKLTPIKNATIIPDLLTDDYKSELMTFNGKSTKMTKLSRSFKIYFSEDGNYVIKGPALGGEYVYKNKEDFINSYQTDLISFKVKPLPENVDNVDFVARDVSLNEQWECNLATWKVGQYCSYTYELTIDDILKELFPKISISFDKSLSSYVMNQQFSARDGTVTYTYRAIVTPTKPGIVLTNPSSFIWFDLTNHKVKRAFIPQMKLDISDKNGYKGRYYGSIFIPNRYIPFIIICLFIPFAIILFRIWKLFNKKDIYKLLYKACNKKDFIKTNALLIQWHEEETKESTNLANIARLNQNFKIAIEHLLEKDNKCFSEIIFAVKEYLMLKGSKHITDINPKR